MNRDNILNFSIELDTKNLQRRFFEVIPGLLSWTTLIVLSILALFLPFWIAIFIIIYDVYVLVRAVYISVHLVYAYRRMQKMKQIDWINRCRKVSSGLDGYIRETANKISVLKQKRWIPKPQRRALWQQKQLLNHLKNTKQSTGRIIPWSEVHHVVIFPTYNESLSVLNTSLKALARADYPKDRIHVVLGFESRVGDIAKKRAAALDKKYRHVFGTFLNTFHPDGLVGEKRVKSANANWAMKKMDELLRHKKINTNNILVSNFDSDTIISREYLAYLTFVFITHPDRYHVSYQPLPMYNNNVWDAPAFSRVIATGSTFWQMIESTRPERLVTFSSHSMTYRALKDVNFWQPDIISEDSRIFWQCLLRYDGHYRTEPLYTSVSMDAAMAKTWWKTLINQYRQKRRWAWGIENFPYIAIGFLSNPRMPLRTKWIYTIRTLEGHYSWATLPIIVAGLGWLPVLFGNPTFRITVLSYSLPYVTRTIMSIAMFGLLISTFLSLLLLPKKPPQYSRWRYLPISLQWALFPIIATALSAIPALDAETRLMLGRDLQFNVMQKSRKAAKEKKPRRFGEVSSN